MAGGDSAEADIFGLFHTLQGHVDDIRSRLQCGICIRPLYEPFSLACGHTFCYTCLTQWFSGGRSKRTCPDCRAPVKSQPAPAYLIREIVQMFTSRAELLDKGETTQEHSVNRQAELEKLDQDKANTHPHTGGLFGGLFKPKAPSLKPLVDVDDGVMRCPHCQWELEEDACGGCGWVYRPDEDRSDFSGSEEDDYGDESDFDSMLDEEDPDEDEFGDIDDDDSAWGPYGAYGTPFLFGERDPAAGIFGPLARALGDHVYHPRSWATAHDGYESHYDDEDDYGEDDYDEEEDDYDEMDSFIDDEDGQTGVQYDSDHSTVVGGNRPSNRASPSRRQGRPVVNLDSSDEDASDHDGGDTTGVAISEEDHSSRAGASSSPPSQYHDTRSSPMQSSVFGDRASEDEVVDEEDDGEEDDNEDDVDEEDEDEHPMTYRRYHQRLEVPASSDESDVADSPSPRLTRPARYTGSTANNAITIPDSDEEQPVGPVRRATQRRRTRFSPY